MELSAWQLLIILNKKIKTKLIKRPNYLAIKKKTSTSKTFVFEKPFKTNFVVIKECGELIFKKLNTTHVSDLSKKNLNGNLHNLKFNAYKVTNIKNTIKKKFKLNKKFKLPLLKKVKKVKKTKRKANKFWKNTLNYNLLSNLLLNKKVVNINVNTATLFTEDIYKKYLKELLIVFPFLQKNRVAARLLGALFNLFVFKNGQGLLIFLKKMFRDIHYSKHNSYYTHVGFLLKNVIAPQLNLFDCQGVRIVFRGKLGVGGNARKRSLKYSTGMYSFSTKFIKINRNYDVIRTKTGVVGFSIVVAW